MEQEFDKNGMNNNNFVSVDSSQVDQEEEDNDMSVIGRDGKSRIRNPSKNPEIKALVQQIREQFLDEYDVNPEFYIEQDIQKIKQHDYFIRRFLYPHDLDPVPAYEQFRTWMAWRKEVGFEEASDQRFPLEFYQIGALFPYLPDRDGVHLLYMRFKVYRKLDILDKAIKQFIIYNMDKLDSMSMRERSWAVVFDTRGAGLSQIDFDMLIFLFRTIKQYYPWGMKYVCVYELPWLLQGGWKLTLKVLPEDATRLFRFCNKSNITELIAPENLPDFMGGSGAKDYREIPEGCRPSEEIGALEMGLTPDEVKTVKKHFEKFLTPESLGT